MTNIKQPVKKSQIHWELSDYDVLNTIMYRKFKKCIEIKEISQLKEYTNPDVFLCRYYGYTRANPIIIQKFTIKSTDIKRKCPTSCRWLINQSNKAQCLGHEVDDFIKNIQNHVKKLNEIRYKTLVPYEFVLYKKKSQHINVYLVQNFQEIYQVYYRLHGSINCFKIIIYDILQTIEFLHKNGLTHSCLDLKYCGLNNSSDCVQFFEYSITPFLRDILNEYQARDDDLQSLGKLCEELWLYMPDSNSISESSQNKPPGIDMPGDLKDFVKKCKYHPQSSVQDLLKHPFLQRDPVISMDKNKLLKTNVKSNLKNDFEILQVLGKGAYGIVLKVKNYFDTNLYAVKRILLQSYEQLYKKSREIELLSILMHENVVRYYNCWIEDASLDSTDEYELDLSLLSICSSPEASKQKFQSLKNLMNISTSILNPINSTSNSIEFKYEPDDVREILSNENQKIQPNKGICKIINIQMEFCEKSTLRKAIDDNLYQDSDRSFRLLCQIVSGLSYIHGKDIIHRDLKPDNIFLNGNDQIKIGDFGQATCVASKVMMMNYDLTNIHAATQVGTTSNAVGTSLYVAPEIMENLPKSVYDYRVDLYSLGIIYYEMCNPPFKTSMERHKKIQGLRDGKLKLSDTDNNKVIKALIQKDPDMRKVSLKTFLCNLKIS